MLNYIWAGLILVSFAFALVQDVRDLARNTYRNDATLPVEVRFPEGYTPDANRQPVEVHLDAATYGAHYGTDAAPDSIYAGTLVQTREGALLQFDAEASLPEPLATVATETNPRDEVLQGEVASFAAVPTGARVVRSAVRFQPVRFVKMNAIGAAALEFATTAAELALGLIGVLALFLGLLKIGEAAGIIRAISRVFEPLLRPLFPEIPKGHPAFSMIVLNLSANFFGLGNAATPFGLKAMEELQTLNPEKDTATNPMVMLLAMNTAGVQLVPPVLLLALMGLQVNQLWIPILIATALGLVASIAMAKLFARLPAYRRTDPNRGGAVVEGGPSHA